MRQLETMMRRLIIFADMQTYSTKDQVAQFHAQREFSRALTQAAGDAGLSDADWMSQKSGDGRLAILPPDTSEIAIVGTFAHRLDDALRAYNRHHTTEAMVRVRIAVHEGVIHMGDNGFVSQAVNATCHLCDCDALRTALDSFPKAGVAMLVTERIYTDVISHQYEGIRADRFRRTRVPEKHGVRSDVWISVVNEDVNTVTLPETPRGQTAENRSAAKPPAAGSTWTFGDVRSSGPTAFGPGASAHQYGDGHER